MEELANELNLKKSSSGNEIVSELERLKAEAMLKNDVCIEPLTGDDISILSQCSNSTKEGWRTHGLELISRGEVAVVVLAGGLGTRLGFDHPKGCYDIGLPSHSSLFQYMCEKLLHLEETANSRFSINSATINLYVMTNKSNAAPTKSFFEEHKFFGLKSSQIFFFCQENIPVIDYEGNVIQEEGGHGDVIRTPNGNGGVFKGLAESGALDDMDTKHIQWIHFVGIDNIMIRCADPVFIGLCDEKKVDLGNKVVRKMNPTESVGIFCWKTPKEEASSSSTPSEQSSSPSPKEEQKPKRRYCLTEYIEMTDEEKHRVDSATGRLSFSAANILSHLFSIHFLHKCCEQRNQLKYHVTKKEKGYVCEGVSVPGKTYKMEKFIPDSFALADKVATVEVLREEEFCPVKNSTGSDSPAVARAMLQNLWNKWIIAAGGKIEFPEESKEKQEESICLVEIPPQVSYDGSELEEYVKGKVFHHGDIISK
ncbi:UDP-N-acetylglucosamine pyrophosphorylase [Monocercomonoides exilis]|uniref:UDP-N-acetylglucosamine pyrophosphorylase n=1 Tax=Monocercomonoides exilis TaxID=2049356 RepID=UPI00355A4810|nr:UDP-N-acetylglucosamine pyrophosphorylase [Monocercomonoides exilis]|eukprot:MONOS_381.1-p1 / transcript=MONOS_381.1 / gene=MONOS_381 / organism=Monocercomonoides_exilis_PA203 / gene_product=UDP-N-acetylhexosamine pyrophosphorylase-like protein 1 / transcript_product=UDP-N-acetylhexosamine pyrophosphorylase-like protein 1 / location=Mono_scaffold00006:140500-142539(-) / protein_length=480 / sequence_SO=supercontig / SO=protein_coding / is_pseudo=false